MANKCVNCKYVCKYSELWYPYKLGCKKGKKLPLFTPWEEGCEDFEEK